MSISVTTASKWPARAAYVAAAVFVAASGGVNVQYGWAKGSDPITCTIWAAVAGAVAIIFALSWPALIRSLECRRWAAAGMALAALLLSGAYSVTAALGSASGGRTQAAAKETTGKGTRERAQGAYDDAKAALGALKASRPLAEVEALVAAARPVCRIVVDSTRRETICTKQPALLVELGRAKERDRLQAALNTASKQLAAAPPPPANTDVTALRRYLLSIGLDVPADRLTDLLVLLSVLMIEAGGGLALSVGMALAAAPGRRPVEVVDAAPLDTGHRERSPAAFPRVLDGRRTDTRTPASVRSSGVRPLSVQPSGVRDWLTDQGGRAVISMRRLASVLGRSPSAVHDELRRLQASGALTLTPGPRGTMIALRPN